MANHLDGLPCGSMHMMKGLSTLRVVRRSLLPSRRRPVVRPVTLVVILAFLVTGCGERSLDPEESDATPTADDTASGLWEPAVPPRTGCAEVFLLHEDGSAESFTVICVGATYSYSEADHRLSITSPDADPMEVIVTFNESGSQMEWRPRGDGPNPFTTRITVSKVGAKHGHIVGLWKHDHYTGETAYEAFLTDGRYQFRLPFAASRSEGHWVSKDEKTVELTVGSGEPQTLVRSGEDLELVLVGSGGGGNGVRFVRSNSGPWYLGASAE